jgi:hypothetical protein
MGNAHAVRWARRKVCGVLDYTRWHWTEDGRFTLCHWSIPLGVPVTFLPETHEDVAIVDCTQCKRRLGAQIDD